MVEDILSVVYLQWLPRLTQLDSSGGGTVTVHTAIYLVMDQLHSNIATLALQTNIFHNTLTYKMYFGPPLPVGTISI